MKDKITFDKFLEIEKQLEIRVGSILSAERVPKSKKLLKLSVAFVDFPRDTKHIFKEGEVKTVVTNIGGDFAPDADIQEHFSGLSMLFIMNLEPVTIMGITSEAMIMVPERADGTISIHQLLYPVGSKLL